MFRNFFSYFIPFFFYYIFFFLSYIYIYIYIFFCLYVRKFFSVIFSFFFFFPFTFFYFLLLLIFISARRYCFCRRLLFCLSVCLWNNFTQPDENCWSYFHENFTTYVHWDKEVFHYNLEVIRREQTLPYVPCCQAEIPALYWVPLWFFSVSMLGNFFSNFFPYFFSIFFFYFL